MDIYKYGCTVSARKNIIFVYVYFSLIFFYYSIISILPMKTRRKLYYFFNVYSILGFYDTGIAQFKP